MFNNVTELAKLKENIALDKIAILVFTTNTCSACHVVKDKVGALMERLAPEAMLYHISIPDLPEASGEFMVFSAPVIIAYLEGQEVLREAGIISIPSLEEHLVRSLNFI